ncbi:MAG: recombinase family protein [Candidatus Humimicrobiia bacterium]
MNKENAACYIRVSSSLQAGEDKYSIPEQKDILTGICNRNNWNPIFFEDIGVSGETIRRRPQFKKILKACSDSIFKNVLVTDQDRLTRNVGDLQYIKDIFRENKINLVVNGDILDLNDEDDDFKSDIDGIFSKRERRVIAKRTARGKYQKAKQGKIPTAGFNIPYGYKRDDQSRMVINEEEARVIGMIFDWIANKGLSCYKIAEKLNSLGIPTRSKSYGKIIRSKINNKIYKAKWTRSSVNHIVRKELYCQDKYIYTSKYYREPVFIDKERIISRKLFEKARNQSTKNKSFHGRVVTALYILRGKMRCMKCGRAYVGSRWHSSKSGKTRYYYRDLGKSNKIREYEEKCTSASIKKDLIENKVKNDIKEFLVNPKILELYLDTNKREDSELADIEYQIIKNDSEMGRLIDLYSEMFIDDPVQEKIIKEKIKENKEKSKALQALKFEAENKAEILKIKKDNLKKISHLLEKIGEGIEKLEDWEWKRIIDKLVDKIEIDSIGGHGKTVKLDIYITYNFDQIVSEKYSYCTNQVHSASKRSSKTCNT